MSAADITIDKEIDALIKREGGYVDHPNDRGGKTNWGVTEVVARAHGYRGDMAKMPRRFAEGIYRARYWQDPKFDAVAEFFPKAAIELFDTGVNMGTGVAARFLQRSLNLLNRGGKAWPELTVDGRIGAMTLDACRRYQVARGKAAEPVLVKCLDGLQLARYVEIAEARPSQEDFFFGWVAHRIGELT